MDRGELHDPQRSPDREKQRGWCRISRDEVGARWRDLGWESCAPFSRILLKIATTGFVEAAAGSVASANALLLRALLDRGHQVDFFSKPSFVDPRPAIGPHANFRFHDCTNSGPDLLRRRVSGIPVLRFAAEQFDARTYNRLLMRSIRRANESPGGPHDLVLWLGDYAHGAVPGVPTVSFAQGAPGTDGRSILRRRREIRDLAGVTKAIRLEVLARLRLSKLGLPRFEYSDAIIVGSRQSCQTLTHVYGVAPEKLSRVPYPVDLDLFRPPDLRQAARAECLRVLWLGRIIPRKRLDLLLDAAALSIDRGLDMSLTIVGGVGFVPGYEKLIHAFRFPDRLEWIRSLPRSQVPKLMERHDVLCQPSEEENFGSSVAEAQACGLRVIVGNTNGNADYLNSRDWQLPDDNPESLATIFCQAAGEAGQQDNAARRVSRGFAENTFNCESAVRGLEAVLHAAAINFGRHGQKADSQLNS
jgi:glycosyltransferase involved in cell wall biosynthesis